VNAQRQRGGRYAPALRQHRKRIRRGGVSPPAGADLISQVTKGSGTYSYEYDDKHQVTKATNDGVSMDVTYDAKGNTTGTVLSGTGINKTISSSAA